MENTLLYTICSIFFLIIFTKLLIQKTRKQHKNLPPSPPSLPIIGHLHLFFKLGSNIHRTLHNLSQKYGQIMSLRIGSRLAIVVSSPSAIEECLTKNDMIFAQRPQFMISKYMAHISGLVDSLSTNDATWRNFRRIITVELFSQSSGLNKFINTRQEDVNLLIRKLHSMACQDFARVELRPMFSELTTSIIMRMVTRKREYGDDNGDLNKKIEQVGEPLKWGMEKLIYWLDFGGLVTKTAGFFKSMDSFLQQLIDEHRMNNNQNPLIHHLLHLHESQPAENRSDTLTKGLISILFLAGIDTTTTALEWAMANLVNNSIVLEKLRAELDDIVGKDRLINESDLPKLKYLRNVILETYRLYPVAPFLLPHSSSSDCTIGGFKIPANTMLLVNIWSMQRDQNLWKDPASFKPERFENGEIETFKLLPFGFGRRSCPGETLANRIISLTLGSLVQCFEWKQVNGKELDMTENILVTMCKSEPLEVLCKARPILDKILF